MKGAKLFAQCLVQQGVEYIFGIPGAKIDALFDALLDTPIKVIVCHHEQNAAFMAAAYGRLTGKPGVALVTSGPGVSNLVTGLLTATTEGDPIVAIGGNVPRAMKLKQSHQGTDNVLLTSAAAKSSIELVMADNIPEVIDNAFRLAVAPRAGAVFISIPQDVLTEETSMQQLSSPSCIRLGAAPQAAIESAAKQIQQAKKPVFLLGLEATRPENTQAIRALLKKTHIAAVNTYQAAGTISKELMDCFVGRVGLFKNQPGDELLDSADLVITVGYGSVEYDPEIWNAKSSQKQIIHIDYIPASIHSTYVPSIEVLGDIATSLQQISILLPARSEVLQSASVKTLQERLQKNIHAKYTQRGSLIHPLHFIESLRKIVNDQTMVISDIGTHYMWLAQHFFTNSPHHLLFSNGQQTLGVALPWAIATKMIFPDRKVISISGDGGFYFSAMELETAVRLNLHFVHCVWCDGTYDMVRQQQLIKYKRDSAVHFGPIDHIKFAESFGAKGLKITHPDELLPLLNKAFSLPGPVIVEIPIDYADNAHLFKTIYQDIGH